VFVTLDMWVAITILDTKQRQAAAHLRSQSSRPCHHDMAMRLSVRVQVCFETWSLDVFCFSRPRSAADVACCCSVRRLTHTVLSDVLLMLN
jgi:hypothetical protein